MEVSLTENLDSTFYEFANGLSAVTKYDPDPKTFYTDIGFGIDSFFRGEPDDVAMVVNHWAGMSSESLLLVEIQQLYKIYLHRNCRNETKIK